MENNFFSISFDFNKKNHNHSNDLVTIINDNNDHFINEFGFFWTNILSFLKVSHENLDIYEYRTKKVFEKIAKWAKTTILNSTQIKRKQLSSRRNGKLDK